MYPKQAELAGIGFPDLIARLIDLGARIRRGGPNAGNGGAAEDEHEGSRATRAASRRSAAPTPIRARRRPAPGPSPPGAAPQAQLGAPLPTPAVAGAAGRPSRSAGCWLLPTGPGCGSAGSPGRARATRPQPAAVGAVLEPGRGVCSRIDGAAAGQRSLATAGRRDGATSRPTSPTRCRGDHHREGRHLRLADERRAPPRRGRWHAHRPARAGCRAAARRSRRCRSSTTAGGAPRNSSSATGSTTPSLAAALRLAAIEPAALGLGGRPGSRSA